MNINKRFKVEEGGEHYRFVQTGHDKNTNFVDKADMKIGKRVGTGQYEIVGVAGKQCEIDELSPEDKLRVLRTKVGELLSQEAA